MSLLLDRLDTHARDRPDEPALVGLHPKDTAIWTFAELAEQVHVRAAAFAAHTPPDDIVPLYLRRSPECVAAMLGIWGAGRRFCVLHHQLRAPQINTVLATSGARLGLVDGPGLMTLRRGFEGPLAEVQWWLVRDGSWSTPHDKQLDRLVASGGSFDELPVVSPMPAWREGGGCCLFTSGSTGVPKGVMIGSDELVSRARGEVDWFELVPGEVLLNVLPYSFDVGLNQLLSAVWAGCTLVISPSFLPADLLQAVAEWRVNGISGVPALWTGMLQAGLSFQTAGAHRSLRYLTVSGGDLLPRHRAALASLAPGVGIYKTYGQTETFRTTSLHPRHFATHGDTVGQACAGVRLAVLRPDGTRAAPGEPGEVVHGGAGLMERYLNQPEETARKLRYCPVLDEVAAYTGDQGFVDEQGFLTLLGRRDGMVKISGFRVFPAEILAQLSRVEGVLEAEVIAVKEDDGEVRLVAFALIGDAFDGSEARVRTALGRVLPAYMVPQRIVLEKRFPRTSSGKPDRVALAETARALLDQGSRSGSS